MRIRPRFLIGAAVIVAAVGYMITMAIQNTSEYYMTVNEAAAKRASLGGQSLRIAGRVRPENIGWDPSSLTLKFSMVQIPDTPPDDTGVKAVAVTSGESFQVVSVGQPKPDMFGPNRDVIVEGKLAPDGSIAATQVLTSCPSKYKPKQGQ